MFSPRVRWKKSDIPARQAIDVGRLGVEWLAAARMPAAAGSAPWHAGRHSRRCRSPARAARGLASVQPCRLRSAISRLPTMMVSRFVEVVGDAHRSIGRWLPSSAYGGACPRRRADVVPPGPAAASAATSWDGDGRIARIFGSNGHRITAVTTDARAVSTLTIAPRCRRSAPTRSRSTAHG